MCYRLVVGGISGLVAQTCTYPLEMIRRRIQTQSMVNRRNISTLYSSSSSSEAKATDDPTSKSTVKSNKTPIVDTKKVSIMRTGKMLVKHGGGLKALFKGVSLNWIKG